MTLALACDLQDAPPAVSIDPMAPPAEAHAPSIAPTGPVTRKHIQAEGQLGPGRGTLIVDIQPPVGAKLTEGAPLVVHAKGQDLGFPKRLRTMLDLEQLPLKLPIDVADGATGPAELELSYYYCETGERAACRPERAKLSISLDLTGSAPGGEAHLTHRPIL